MTISVSKIVSPDLFTKNESVMFDRHRAAQYSETMPALGAVTFVASKSDACSDLEELAVACGREAFSFVTSIVDGSYRVWLFVSDGPWRPATRIASHYGLWRSHPGLVESSGVLRVGEAVKIESNGLVRFAGLLEVTDDALVNSIRMLRTNSACAIICSNRPNIDSEASVRSIFMSAFPANNGAQLVSVDWMMLAMQLCAQGDVLIRVTGLFDDREAAVDVIAGKAVLTHETTQRENKGDEDHF